MKVKAPLRYAKTVIKGIPVRPDSRSIMMKAVEGHPVVVDSGSDYINLYHVFDRMRAQDHRLGRLELVRRQVGRSRWLVYATDDPSSLPEPELEPEYDPKRGRYKRYARQLAEGAVLKFETKAEATKARRAWHLYVSKAERRRLTSSIRPLSRSSYEVRIRHRISDVHRD